MPTATAINNISNDAEATLLEPYIVRLSVEGSAAFIFHRWSVDGVEAKAKAAKGSKAKKTDDIESYVYRTPEGNLAIPAEYFRMSIVNAAKYKQDPRSPRKSAMDLFKAGIVVLEELCDTGKVEWDYIDRRRVMVQRQGITRHRPALLTGWKCTAHLQVLLPEYISPQLLNETIASAGRLVGVGDFRPTFGRFLITEFVIETGF
jgi:hypothetical protein